MKTKIVFVVSLSFLFLSCAKKRMEKQAEEDATIIQQYIIENDLDAMSTSSGLHYTVDTPGSGASCNAFSTVTVAYKGSLTNGTVFDESSEEGVTFNLQNVIQGWTEGIPFYKEGGKGILLIPSALGYGDRQVSSIPRNSVLIFEVELIEVL